MSTVREVVREIYAQVRAPSWAAPNLDALADVLRDLSWLPTGPVVVVVPDAAPDSVVNVLEGAVAESASTDRPVQLRPPEVKGSP